MRKGVAPSAESCWGREYVLKKEFRGNRGPGNI